MHSPNHSARCVFEAETWKKKNLSEKAFAVSWFLNIFLGGSSPALEKVLFSSFGEGPALKLWRRSCSAALEKVLISVVPHGDNLLFFQNHSQWIHLNNKWLLNQPVTLLHYNACDPTGHRARSRLVAVNHSLLRPLLSWPVCFSLCLSFCVVR